MATYTRYVDPNSTAGGDGTTNALAGANRAYVSLNAWEAAEQAAHGAGDIDEVVCSSDDAGSTHVEDTTAFTIDGWTDKNGTGYIKIRGATRLGTKWNANIYRLSVTDMHVCGIAEAYVWIDSVQMRRVGTSTAAYHGGPYVGAYGSGKSAWTRLSNCIFYGSNKTGCAVRLAADFNDHDGTVYVWNTIGGNMGSASYFYVFLQEATSNGHMVCYNCTAVGQETGGATIAYYGNNANAGHTMILVNCIAQAVGATAITCAGNFDTTNSDYNVADGATVPNTTNKKTSTDVSFVSFTGTDATAWDLALANGDTAARNWGKSDPGSGLFSDDIVGTTRPVGLSWDAGAHENSSAGGGIPIKMYHYTQH